MNILKMEDVMTKAPLTVNTEDPLTVVKKVFDAHRFHHLPVLDEHKKCVGIISRTDMDKFSWGKSLFANPKREEYNEALFHTVRVLDVMTPNAFTLEAQDTVEDAYRIFKSEIFRAIPIVNKGILVGIVTPIDLVGALISNNKND